MAIKKAPKLSMPPKKRMKCLILLAREEGVGEIAELIRHILHKNNVIPISFEDRLQVGALWVDGVMASLREADFLIADVTGRNANVLFELGIAHGLGKPFVLLVSVNGNGDIPTDLMGYQYIAYDPMDLYGLRDKLERFIQHVVDRLERTA